MKTTYPVLISSFLGFCLLMTGFTPGTSAGEKREAKHSFTKHFRETLFDITTKAEFSVEILLDDREYKKLGRDVLGIVIHNSHDEDVEKAAIAIDFRNLDTGKPAVEKPVVKEKGDGLYTVSGLNVLKEGRWKLTITIKKGDAEDSVRFLFPDATKNPMPAGRYNP